MATQPLLNVKDLWDVGAMKNEKYYQVESPIIFLNINLFFIIYNGAVGARCSPATTLLAS